MKPPRVELQKDHLVVRLEGLAAVSSLRRTVLVPYSTIENAEVGEPRWPRAREQARWLGTLVPGRLAQGSFVQRGGQRRFVDLERDASQALTIRLSGHPEYDEITLALPDAGEVLQEISKHAAVAPAIPPTFE